MNNVIYNALLHQRQEIHNLTSKYSITRHLESNLRTALQSNLIKVITGPRRAGKSLLALRCLKDTHFGYVNFEDNTLPINVDTDQLIESIDSIYEKPKIIFFDEIQILPRWEQFLNKLHRRGYNIVVTGSNSHLLSGEFSSSLTGRHIALELLPLSFSEFITEPQYMRSAPTNNGAILKQKLFEQYWQRGGFPEVSLGKEDPQEYLSLLLNSIIFKDIVQRFKLRNPQAIVSFLSLMMEEPTARFSANNIQKALPAPSLSVTSILKYIDMAINAYLLFELQPFFAKPRKRIKADRKLYVIDHALAAVRNVGISDKLGATLENIIFIELVRRGYVPNEKLFYLQTPKGREVDFLVKQDRGTIHLIQVSYDLSSLKTLDRELSALTEAAQLTGAKQLTIITRNEQRKINHDGFDIDVIPAYRWLTER